MNNSITPFFSYLSEYLPLIIFFGVACFISMLLIVLAWVLAPSNSNSEKLSTYECGFDPIDDSRKRFDVRFYLVSLLFIIFDLEIALLFPWATNIVYIGWNGFFVVLLFLIVLTIGFVYEWKKGALDWE